MPAVRSAILLASLVLAHAASAQTSPDALVGEVRTLAAAADNDARFEALTALLRVHNLAFTVETFTLDKPPAAGPNAAPDPRVRGRNVVVTLGTGRETVVVGAHYDAKWINETTLSKGAVDNAASSVMLVHTAAALRGQKFKSKVTFVWFDFEESGLIGSAKYAEAHAGDRIKAMLNYDINGYGDTIIFGPPVGGEDPRLQLVMLETCAAEKVSCLHFAGMPPGDDRSFGARKIPTISIAILPAAEAHQLWLMLHAKSAGLEKGFAPPIFATIHTPNDLPEKLDATAMTTAGRLAQALIRRVSELR